MSGGPFRELFVELSREAFDLAKNLGVAAVREATERVERMGAAAVYRPTSSTLLGLERVGSAVCARYEWARVAFAYSEFDRCIEVNARLRCGHRVKYFLEEEEVVASPVRGLLDALDLQVERTPQHCYCVARRW